MKTIRVWVVEDHAGYRADLIRTLGRCGVDCVNELETAIGLEEDLAAKPLPDAVLLDLRMPGGSGVEALTALRKEHPKLPVVMLTASDDEVDLMAAIRAGATGYLLKTSTGSEIRQALEAALAGGNPVDATMAGALFAEVRGNAAEGEAHGLSPREMEVLRGLADGLAVKQIAAELGLSAHTVDSHLRTLYRKLDVPNQSGAVAQAFRLGLLR